ncbi:hypothetical protein JCM8547_008199 [Rhodosporidiobolus lusitaniae]
MGLRAWWRNERAEAKEAWHEIWQFCKTHDWKKTTKTAFRPKYWIWWILGIALCVAIGFLAHYRDAIVEKFEPHKDTIVDFPVSWIYPIIILVILSFPPLGGHELVLLVVGLIWGLWVGFAIACAGTLIGEILCFYLFKYVLTTRAAAVERESIMYACIARLMRDGGLWIIIVVRFSAVPGHVVTAIQSTVGMPVWVYTIAIIVSLPKQLVVVYLGDRFAETDEANKTRDSMISWVVLVVTGVATVAALYIVYMRARKLYPQVLADMEERGGSKDSLTHPSSVEDPEAHIGGGGRPGSMRRRDSLVEAAFEGDKAGIDYVQRPGGGGGGAPGMRRTETGGTWRSSFDGDGGDEWDDRSPRHGRGGDAGVGGAWQDGMQSADAGAGRGAGRHGRPYDPLQGGGGGGGGAAESFSHLPLASESEVGVVSREPLVGGGGRTVPPSYVSRPSFPPSNPSNTPQGNLLTPSSHPHPYSDPFVNPSQQSFSSTPMQSRQHSAQSAHSSISAGSTPRIPPPPSSHSVPYGTAPYGSLPSSSTVDIPLSHPVQLRTEPIPYIPPPPQQFQPGSRPVSQGGTEMMTGVGAGGRAGRAGGGGYGGGQYGATGERR